jgi:monoamine oxidase
LEALFPGIGSYIDDIEVFTFPHAVAHWPVALGRSRFDALANHLRSPMGNVFLAGDSLLGSHSEASSLTALAIAKQLRRVMHAHDMN